jgi:cell division protease FtsH
MGTERRSMVMTDDEKRLTAYHEGGHAIVGLHTPASDPIHKATIIPRGKALGMVVRLPEGDRISVSREKLIADITVAMGGRVAEEIIFGHDKVTSGAAQDIRVATQIARSMVTQFGMSDELGPLSYGENEQEIFLGHSITQTKNVSELTAQKIDAEIRKIVDLCYARARQILTDNLDQLHRLAKALLEYETLTGEDVQSVLRGEAISRTDEAAEAGAAERPSTLPQAGKKTGPGMEPRPQPGA